MKLEAGRDEHVDAGEGFTRRDFMVSLGVAAGVAITGYFVVPAGTEPQPLPQAASDTRGSLPRLRHDVTMESDGDWTTIARGVGATVPRCAANRVGAEVLRRLDGRHTVEQVSEGVAQAIGIGRTDELDARVACFVADLAALGFLREPFHVCIYESRSSS